MSFVEMSSVEKYLKGLGAEKSGFTALREVVDSDEAATSMLTGEKPIGARVAVQLADRVQGADPDEILARSSADVVAAKAAKAKKTGRKKSGSARSPVGRVLVPQPREL